MQAFSSITHLRLRLWHAVCKARLLPWRWLWGHHRRLGPRVSPPVWVDGIGGALVVCKSTCKQHQPHEEPNQTQCPGNVRDASYHASALASTRTMQGTCACQRLAGLEQYLHIINHCLPSARLLGLCPRLFAGDVKPDGSPARQALLALTGLCDPLAIVLLCGHGAAAWRWRDGDANCCTGASCKGAAAARGCACACPIGMESMCDQLNCSRLCIIEITPLSPTRALCCLQNALLHIDLVSGLLHSDVHAYITMLH